MLVSTCTFSRENDSWLKVYEHLARLLRFRGRLVGKRGHHLVDIGRAGRPRVVAAPATRRGGGRLLARRLSTGAAHRQRGTGDQRYGCGPFRRSHRSSSEPGFIAVMKPAVSPGCETGGQNWKRTCSWSLRMSCALVAAPNPAVLGVNRVGSIEPSASVCEFTIVSRASRSGSRSRRCSGSCRSSDCNRLHEIAAVIPRSQSLSRPFSRGSRGRPRPGANRSGPMDHVRCAPAPCSIGPPGRVAA